MAGTLSIHVRGKCRLEFGHQVAVVSARTSFLLLENKIKEETWNKKVKTLHGNPSF